MMAAILPIDQESAIRALTDETSLSADDAAGIIKIVTRFLVQPAFEKSASKHGEASARGKLRTAIDKAVGVLDSIQASMVTKDELKAALDAKPWKADLTEMKNDMLLKFGAMLVGAVVFLTFMQGFFK